MNDTIAAIATAHGVGSIAIVRLSGPSSLDIALKITEKTDLTPRMATLCSLYDSFRQLIDEAIVIYFKAPHSFTTEDVIEFQCHGGVIVAQSILEACLYHHARPAAPGEFTKRAFLGGRIDLAQAEAAARLIESKSADSAHLLARQLKGELSHFVESIRENLSTVLAHSEVSIDYAEEDLPETIFQKIQTDLDGIAVTLETTIQASLRRQGMVEGFRLAIVGKPNVGKSSLLNRMLNFERAIVSDIAGTTRDTIEESLKVGTHIIKIVDTAGIRHASDGIEQIGIERSHKAMEESDIILALFNSHEPLTPEDRQILELLSQHGSKKVIYLLTKCDLDQHMASEEFSQKRPLLLGKESSLTPLFELIEGHLNQESDYDDLILTSTRQIDALDSTRKAILSALDILESHEMELFSYHIREAIQSIASITRPYENADLLDAMFSNFCLGK